MKQQIASSAWRYKKRNFKKNNILRFIIFVILFFTGVTLQWFDNISTISLYFSHGILLVALMIGLHRGGIYGYAFWFPLASIYPLLTPLLVQTLLGYEYFSNYARFLQTAEIMGPPILLGALASLYLALSIPDQSIYADTRKSLPRRPLERPKLGTRTAVLIMGLSLPLIILFAWLSEPGEIIGVVNYDTLRAQRFSGVRFAGGAWVVFEVLGLAAYLRLQHGRHKVAKLAYWCVSAATFIWLFLHARRSETLGLAILLFCVFRPNGSEIRLFLSRWLNFKFLILVIIILAFSAIGYFRGTGDWSALGRVDYLQSPGGGGNNLLTYVASYYLYYSDLINIKPGETYWAYLVNLPPEGLGLPRASTASNAVEARIDLMGGQYWLMEPTLNFGYIGMLGYLLIINFFSGWSVKAINMYREGEVTIHAFMQAAVFLALMFRTMWYGPDSIINGAIMAFLVGSVILAAQRISSKTC